MTDVRITDSALRAALAPDDTTHAVSAALAGTISERTRAIAQARAGFRWSWNDAPAATRAEATRLRLVRIALVGALLGSAALAGAIGARLLTPRAAAPQLLFVRGGVLSAVTDTGSAPLRIGPLASRFLQDFNVSPDGTRVATLTQGGTVELWDAPDLLAGLPTRPTEADLPKGMLPGYGMDWMQDGRSLLLAVAYKGDRSLYLVDARSGRGRLITPGGLFVDGYWPSPDSHRVAVVGQREGSWGVWIVDPDAGTTRRLVDRLDGAIPVALGIRWDPDSKTIVVPAERSPGRALWVVPVDAPEGSRPTRVTGYDEYATDPIFDSTGTWIVYVRNDAGGCPLQLMKVRPDGSEASALLANTIPVGWDASTNSLIAEADEPFAGAPLGAIVSIPLAGGAPRVLMPLLSTDENRNEARVLWACHPYGLFAHWYGGYGHR